MTGRNRQSEPVSEHTEPLLADQQAEEVPYTRWQETEEGEEPTAYKHTPRRWGLFAPLKTVFTALSVTIALFLLINSELHASRVPAAISESSDSKGDIKFVLHPEDHVSRDAKVIHLSWNITKAPLAPDGVQRDVIFINGKSPAGTCRDETNCQANSLVPQSRLDLATPW